MSEQEEISEPFAYLLPRNHCAKAGTAAIADYACETGGLAKPHSRTFRYERNLSVTRSDYGLQSESGESDWECCYVLNLADLADKSHDLVFRAGAGNPASDEEDLGVDLLLNCPDAPSGKIAGAHFEILLGSGGVWIIKSTSETRATTLVANGERKVLLNGASQVLRYKINEIEFGTWKCDIVFTLQDRMSYMKYLKQRDSILEVLGRPIPDKRIWALPSSVETRKIGSAIVQGSAGRDASGNFVGVDVETGEPLSIRSIGMGSHSKWEDVLPDLQVLMSFNNLRGFPTVKEVCCDCGVSLDFQALAYQTGVPEPFCDEPYHTIHIITPLPCMNLRQWDWEHTESYFFLTVFRDLLHALLLLHEACYAQRDIQDCDILLMSINPPVAAIGTFKMVMKLQTSSDQAVGSTFRKAQDTRAYHHDLSQDMWDLAVRGLSMLFPITHKAFTDGNGARSPGWYSAMSSLLSEYAYIDLEKSQIAQVLRDMLHSNSGKRPSAASALLSLPEYDWECLCYKDCLKSSSDKPADILKRKEAPTSRQWTPTKYIKRGSDDDQADVEHKDSDQEQYEEEEHDQNKGEQPEENSRYPSGGSKTTSRSIATPITSQDSSMHREATPSESDDGLVIETLDPFDDAVRILRELPPGSDLGDLDIRLPGEIGLCEFISRCRGEDAVLVRQLDREGWNKEAYSFRIHVKNEDNGAIAETLRPRQIVNGKEVRDCPSGGPISLRQYCANQKANSNRQMLIPTSLFRGIKRSLRIYREALDYYEPKDDGEHLGTSGKKLICIGQDFVVSGVSAEGIVNEVFPIQNPESGESDEEAESNPDVHQGDEESEERGEEDVGEAAEQSYQTDSDHSSKWSVET